MQVWKTLGRKPVGLEVPEPPEELLYLWDWFLDLFSGQQLTFTELRNWAELNGIRLDPFEVEALRSLDRDYWSVRHAG